MQSVPKSKIFEVFKIINARPQPNCLAARLSIFEWTKFKTLTNQYFTKIRVDLVSVGRNDSCVISVL